ncbi:MAG: hypothetical protein WCR07_16245 [Verrucomicrobiota bacterium]|jgi:hypothetical protein
MGKQRTSNIINEAEARASALRSIESQLDFGPSLSVRIYVETINEARAKLGNLNDLTARLDVERVGFREIEAKVQDLSSRILKAVQARFGPDSDEYKMAGGTLRSERKRPTRRDKEEGGTPDKA